MAHARSRRRCWSIQLFLVVNILLLLNGCSLELDQYRRRRRRRTTRLDLHPTSAWAEQSWWRHHANISFVVHRHWFEQNAIYATIPDVNDPMHLNNHVLQEYHAMRHLSRYERAYREENRLDLERGWNGTYVFENETLSSTARLLLSSATRAATNNKPRPGGTFDNFQAVPLSQGYGTHFANVWVGSPTPQRKTVIVDTGSHYTAFPCSGCQNCGGPHHTDPYFNPSKSTTFHPLQCDECRDGVLCENGQCRFSQSYTEGSSWEAVQVQDRFYCGGSDVLDSVEPGDERYAMDFMFGCQVSMTGLFITQLADGIMGMSAHPATLPKQLYDRRMTEHNVFAMCYRRELGTSRRGVTAGSMTLGGYSTTLDTSPVIYAKNMASLGWYTIYVKNIYIRSGGGQSALSTDPNHKTIRVRVDPATLNSGKGVIVDSGTTDTYLNRAVAKEFGKAWKKATGRAYSHSPIRLSDEQLRALPTILVQCHAYSQKADASIETYDTIPGYTGKLDPKNPNDLLIAIPATSYMDYSPIMNHYTSRVYFTETAGGVLGSNAMQGHNVVFDWENGRIGFAESSCTYDKKSVPTATVDEGFSTDCSLAEPVLTQACIDTVDQRPCEYSPTNIALLGTEVWAAVVEDAGSLTGSLCVDTMEDNGDGIDSPKVQCLGNGVCEEHRPCQLTCVQAAKAAKVVPASLSESRRLRCGDSRWSACDYGCSQTRIESIAYSDGFCHEVSRRSRSCHIGACARSDPCRVPYVVHTAIGLRSGQARRWSVTSEDVFVTALTRAAGSLSREKLFDEGDVNLLAVLPWFKDDNDNAERNRRYLGDTDDTALGLKLVVEISIFNPRAQLANETLTVEEPPEMTGSDGRLSSLVRNITDRFSRKSRKTTCHPDDMYALAQKALHLKKDVLQREGFLTLLAGEIQRAEGEGNHQQPSPFEQVNQDEYVSESRLLSVWSISTEIDDEINYFGPPKPWWVRLLGALHTVIFMFTGVMLFTSTWAFISSCIEALREEGKGRRSWFPFWKKRPRYSQVSIDDDVVEDTIMTGGGSVELTLQTPQLHRHRGTAPKKRRSTLYSQQSSDMSDRGI